MKPTRLISPPGTYFVTSTTFQRRRFFIVENYARLFLKTLYKYRGEQKFELHAFILMPDHFHLLLTLAPDITLERAIQLIKGGYSHAVGEQIGRQELWQKALPIIAFATPMILPGIVYISIKIRSRPD